MLIRYSECSSSSYSGSGAGLSSFDALGRSTLNPLDALDKQISATRVEEEEEEDSVIEDGDVGTPESLVAIGAAELVFAAPPLVRLLPSAPPQSMARRSSEVARPLTRAESLSQLKVRSVREENISNILSIFFIKSIRFSPDVFISYSFLFFRRYFTFPHNTVGTRRVAVASQAHSIVAPHGDLAARTIRTALHYRFAVVYFVW